MWLNDGTIAFTQSVDGRVTGAYFEGEGEVLVRPPDRRERASLGLFTKQGVLEEQFSSAYLRFNDDTASELQPYLRPARMAPPSSRAMMRWRAGLQPWMRCGWRSHSPADRHRSPGSDPPTARSTAACAEWPLTHLGIFDVYFDTLSPEQIIVGQTLTARTKRITTCG